MASPLFVSSAFCRTVDCFAELVVYRNFIYANVTDIYLGDCFHRSIGS